MYNLMLNTNPKTLFHYKLFSLLNHLSLTRDRIKKFKINVYFQIAQTIQL